MWSNGSIVLWDLFSTENSARFLAMTKRNMNYPLFACICYRHAWFTLIPLIIQQVLSEPEWKNRLTEEDKRLLTPLLHSHINPYGLFPLNMEEHLLIEIARDKKFKNEVVQELEPGRAIA